MTKLEKDVSRARAKYLRYIRLRSDCKNENGVRFKDFDSKLLEAEEDYHILCNKLNKKPKKKVAKSKDTKYVVAGNGKTIWDL